MNNKSDFGATRGAQGSGTYFCCTKPAETNSRFCGADTVNDTDICTCTQGVFAPWGNRKKGGPYYAAPLLGVRYRDPRVANDRARIIEFFNKIPEGALKLNMSAEKLVGELTRITGKFSPKPKKKKTKKDKKRASFAGGDEGAGSSSGAKRRKGSDGERVWRPMKVSGWGAFIENFAPVRVAMEANPSLFAEYKLVAGFMYKTIHGDEFESPTQATKEEAVAAAAYVNKSHFFDMLKKERTATTDVLPSDVEIKNKKKEIKALERRLSKVTGELEEVKKAQAASVKEAEEAASLAVAEEEAESQSPAAPVAVGGLAGKERSEHPGDSGDDADGSE